MLSFIGLRCSSLARKGLLLIVTVIVFAGCDPRREATLELLGPQVDNFRQLFRTALTIIPPAGAPPRARAVQFSPTPAYTGFLSSSNTDIVMFQNIQSLWAPAPARPPLGFEGPLIWALRYIDDKSPLTPEERQEESSRFRTMFEWVLALRYVVFIRLHELSEGENSARTPPAVAVLEAFILSVDYARVEGSVSIPLQSAELVMDGKALRELLANELSGLTGGVFRLQEPMHCCDRDSPP